MVISRVYSLRDSNRHRLAQGRDRIKLGVQFYGQEVLPSDPPAGE